MNRIYALVWNPRLGAWSVAHEHSRRRGKGAGAVLAAALLLPLAAIAADLPTGGNVVSGSGQISTPSAKQMLIDQASNKLAIDWQSFDIGSGNKVTFHQPGRDSVALNRVLGADGSKIMGQLDANGRVFIINPNGVLFGAGASVNVGGLVASTLDISNSDFEAGNYRFKGDGSNASVTNNGTLTAADGGSIALLGGTVSNNGVIVANQGTVALAAGNAMTLDFAGDGLLNLKVDEAVVDALVANHQLIKADGGQVLLTANAGDALLKTVVNNTGVIEARTLGEKEGKIVLLGSFDGGTVQVAGTLDASAPNGGDGGFIDTSGAHVKVADGAKVTTKATTGKTGKWLIDPNDFTIAASGGDMTGTAVSAAVQNNNFEIQTATQGTPNGNGDIHVNDAITWNSGNTLTLNAERNININATITAQHATGKVALKYGQATSAGGTADYSFKAPINLQSGNNFITQKGSIGAVISYTVVNDATALQAMNNNRAGNYAVGSNIDLSSISNWVPVGNGSSSFSGQFDGLGHTLSNITIDLSAKDYVGLFGSTAGGSVIRDIGLVGGSVKGGYGVGGLVGFNSGTISNAYATVSVTGTNVVGGLVGNSSFGTISNAYATGIVSGSNSVGGLVGNNEFGTISNAYATGNVSGTYSVGGLVGNNSAGTISNAYATGIVSGNDDVGGLVGYDNGALNRSFYATTNAGGSAINNGGATTGSFTGNAYGTGKTWSELSDQATFAGWDTNIWSFPGVGASVAGYGLGGLPYLTGITRQADIIKSTLFAGGFGTQNSAYTITSWQQLANISQVLSGGYYFSLSNNLDQNSLGYATLAGASANGGLGWNPLGNGSSQFIGTFNGLSHTISDLFINRSDTSYVGLFGYAGSGSVIRDIGLVGGSVSGSNGSSYSGALVSYNAGTINNAYATGSVSANGVNGGNGIGGGLVGYNAGSINNAYATGSVSANGGNGGLSTGGSGYSGGLVGYNAGSINNAYATGSVSATGGVSGLGIVGFSFGGGLVGRLAGGSITNSFYATSNASGNTINNGGATTGQFSGNANGTGKTWAQLTQASTFTGWDIASTGGSNAIWRIYDGYSGPLLRSFLRSVTLTANTSSSNKTYDGTAATGTTTYTGSDLDTGKLLGSLSYTSNSKNAGTYSSADGSLTLGGLHSGQQGYDISYADTSLTISKADLAVTGISANDKTYDATTAATLTGSASVTAIGSDVVSVSGTGVGTFADKNVGTDKSVTVSGYSLSGSDASNYNLLQPTGLTATISKADLAVSGISASNKTYDASTTATLTGTAAVNGFTDDEVSVSGTGVGTFADKHAGAGKAVSVIGYSLSGSDAGNYNILQPTGLAATISKADLAVTGISANNKTYDATTAATLTGSASVTAIGSDVVSVSGTGVGSFADKNVGTDKSVTVSGYSLSGSDAGNYNIVQPKGLAADITKANLTITANNASKTAGQSIALSGYSASGLVGDDSVTSVSLSSLGQPTTAAAGSYAIVAGDAVGESLSNYAINYRDGSLLVTAAASQPTTSSSQPYIGALASNGHTGAAQEPAKIFETLRQTILITSPLEAGLNLQVINHGMRLPEGI